MAELGSTTDPRALVPGKPDAVREEIAQCNRTSAAYLRAGDGLKHLDTADWEGKAADAFHEAFDGHPSAWIKAGDAFLDAANALTEYVETLEWAQQRAGEAIAVWREGQQAGEQARAQHEAAVQQAQQAGESPPEFTDPGAEKRQQAQDLLHRARGQLNEAGERAADALDDARDRAPDKPGFWGSVGSGVSQFFQGVGDWAGDIGDIVTNLDQIPASVRSAFAHPVEFAKGMVSWDQFHTNPTRAAGHVLPDAILSALGGAGAAKKGGDVLSGVNTALKSAKSQRILDKATYNGKNIADHVANRGTDIGHEPPKKKKTPMRHVDSAEDINEAWENLSRGGTPIERPGYDKIVMLPDGSTVGYRTKSGQGPESTVLDLRDPTKNELKIHIDPKQGGK
ncbi:uncharacterized protein YukE [Actinopolyspora biskrensis]|uniref:Uncharacterized protein YukE n=1 Tax=Actinopolyspora biskrensis TaxID=1470178 RepID=A0A852Z9C5_9ACTN|nr:hypothetical protein [Actinopolyspora biskrensis]NYH80146.1 uncharacterized protein YukE [Actinopolyspora biskrensis]